jgi:hypothetical protein
MHDEAELAKTYRKELLEPMLRVVDEVERIRQTTGTATGTSTSVDPTPDQG